MRVVGVDLDWETMAVIREMDRVCFPWDGEPSFNGSHWWIAYDDDKPVAYASLQHLYADRGFLSRAGVLPAYRGRGLQRRLIRARERGARSMDLKRLVTYTSVHNVASSNNLIRAGYLLYVPDGGSSFNWWYRDL